jgi:hypothetical protein
MESRGRRPNVLVVEGHDDRMSVIGLMEHHVDWPDGKENAPVYIDLGLSAAEILVKKYLSTQLKAPGLRRFGVMVDADTKAKSRYTILRNICQEYFPSLPIEMPAGGVVVEHNGMRFGAWIMPDNISGGDLETFLRYLVPVDAEATWQHAIQSVAAAREMGASCKEAHVAKANLYTWLSWQGEPGQSPGRALTQKILNPFGEHGSIFVKWFSDLYELQPIATTILSA